MHKYIILQNKTKKENEYVYQKFKKNNGIC